jgi:uncharacterized protein
MKILRRGLAALIALYVGGVALLYAYQRQILFPASTVRTPPATAGLAKADELILNTDDGERLVAWHVPPREGRPVVIFFHGNGDTLAGRAGRFRELTEAGLGLLAVAFRGYAGSSGHPSEEGLRRDGAAAYAFAAERYPASHIVLWGYSLGSGIAVGLAAERPVAKLVLEAPYTSVADVAAGMFPFVPVRWLIRDQLRSDERIGAVKAPILILHGARDQAIAIAFGERLYALAPAPKRFVRFPDGRHENLEDHGVVKAVLAFLDEPPS